jgi:hypothetical protein
MPYRIDQLPNKTRRSVMDIYNAKSVLSSQSRCCSHSIASVSPDHLLICFKTPVNQSMIVSCFWLDVAVEDGLERTHAPPELSEPAITSTRPFPILRVEKVENKMESKRTSEGQMLWQSVSKQEAGEVKWWSATVEVPFSAGAGTSRLAI